jgi:Na+/phosphate symporter
MLQTALGRFFAVAGGRGRPHAGSNVLEDQTSPGVAVGTAAGPRWAAVITTSLLFAAVHGQVAFFVPLFVLSAGLGFLYERTGNLWSTITVHSLFNLINTLLFLYSTN